MSPDSRGRARSLSLLLASLVMVGCEAVLSLGPEPDRDRASTASSADAASSTSSGGPGGAGQGGSDGEGGGASSSSAASSTSSSTGAGGASAYAAAVAEDSPLVHLRLGDQGGPVAAAAIGEDGVYLDAEADAYGFQEPGAIVGDPDTAVRLGGGGILLGDAFDPSGTRPFTFEVWMKPTGETTDSYHRIFSKELGADSSEGVSLWIEADDLRLQRSLGGEVQFAQTTGIAAGRFHHVVATFDGVDVALYVDGELADGQIYGETVSVRSDLDPLHVGVASYYGDHYLYAVLDEVAVYDFALSPGRIALHHAIGTGQ